MPNDSATNPSWTEMPVRLAAEPAVCVGLVALANDGTMAVEAALQLTADPAVEALFTSCTALRTAGLVDRLEAAIGRPVVTSNQAVAWDLLRQCGGGRSIPGAGRLLGLV